MVYRISKSSRDIKGTIHLTASKSESNRVLIIRSLCSTPFEITNLAEAQDTRTLQQILHDAAHAKSSVFDAGAAGTAMRFLTAYFSINEGERILTGSERMKQRPIGILADALRGLGASIEYQEKQGFPPLLIEGRKLKGGAIEVDGSISSQYISALLMIAPTLENGLDVHLAGKITSRPYINMTLRIMERFGIRYTWSNNVISISPQQYVPPAKQYTIEADWSAASYYYEMAAFAEEADLTIMGLSHNSLQGDAVVAEIYKKFGVQTQYMDGGIRISKGWKPSRTLSYNFEDCPDLAQTVTVTLAGLKIPALLAGLHTLGIKETDRINALEQEVAKLGARLDTSDDRIIYNAFDPVVPPQAPIATYDDHRMAMAFAPLALLFGEVLIEDPQVVSKSYPAFWSDLSSLGFTIEETPS